MSGITRRGMLVALVLAGVALTSCRDPYAGRGGAGGAGAEAEDGTAARAGATVRIGWTAWSDAEFVTRLAARLLRERMGRDVELVQMDIAPQYQGLASGDIDLTLMAWMPKTHAPYLERVRGQVVNLGVLYSGARLGLAVPAYVPEDEVGSIDDLRRREVRAGFGSEIQGIDPGSGLMQMTERAQSAYGLEDYELVATSGAAMTAALSRAIGAGERIVVTAWRPHWMFSTWSLRFLDDPRAVYGRAERVHALARAGFCQEEPEICAFVSRISIPIGDLEESIGFATEHSYEQAVDRYIERHPNRVTYWVTGRMDEPGG